MPRAEVQLHPARPVAPARTAATLLLWRDSADGPQVLMSRRSAQASFVPGAWVFPGGAIDATDAAAVEQARCRPSQPSEQRVAALAAIRETFEELGLLLARHPDGRWADDADLAALDRHAPLAPQCAARGLSLAVDALHLLARWVTDRDLPKRFDVPFFVAPAPIGQTPAPDNREQFEAVWVRPADALARHAAGQFFMIFPTLRTLERLQSHPDVASLMAACSADEAPLWCSTPRAGLLGGQEARFMEHEPPFGELALVCPDGQIRHALDWQSERAVPLLRHVQRLTAPNPGRMTGPGTNTYIVGTPASGFVVIDPGPADAAHVQRLVQATDGAVRAIVCTHSHPDHAPGSALLQALCHPRPPILGLPSAPTARPGSAFTPNQLLQNDELLVLSESGLEAIFPQISSAPDNAQCGSADRPAADPPKALRHTLRVVHTPGHAANHLCLLLEEDGLLFSGDHILSGSTTVIDPPDGDMDAYLRSLDDLAARCAAHDVHYILPAHGHVIGGPDDEAQRAIATLKAHRLAREAKVGAALARHPSGALDDWLPQVYDDVPPALWPVARRSLLAHVQRLRPGWHDAAG